MSKTSLPNIYEKFSEKECPNLSFQVMDATQLTFENSFVLVFSNAVLHWVNNHKLVVEGLYKSLKNVITNGW